MRRSAIAAAMIAWCAIAHADPREPAAVVIAIDRSMPPAALAAVTDGLSRSLAALAPTDELAIVTFGSTASVQVPLRPIGPHARPHAYVFLVDRSPSIGAPRLEAEKTIVRTAVEHASADDTIAVVAYDGAVSVVVPPQHASNRARITNAIARIELGGGTDLYRGLNDAYQIARDLEPRRRAVIVLSDGYAPTDGIAELLDTMTAANIEVSTVGFADEKLGILEMIADRGVGRMYVIDDPAHLPNLIEKMP